MSAPQLGNPDNPATMVLFLTSEWEPVGPGSDNIALVKIDLSDGSHVYLMPPKTKAACEALLALAPEHEISQVAKKFNPYHDRHTGRFTFANDPDLAHGEQTALPGMEGAPQPPIERPRHLAPPHTDSQGYLVDDEGHLADAQGRRIYTDSAGQLINEDGRYVDTQGNLIDINGYLVDEDGNYFYDENNERRVSVAPPVERWEGPRPESKIGHGVSVPDVTDEAYQQGREHELGSKQDPQWEMQKQADALKRREMMARYPEYRTEESRKALVEKFAQEFGYGEGAVRLTLDADVPEEVLKQRPLASYTPGGFMGEDLLEVYELGWTKTPDELRACIAHEVAHKHWFAIQQVGQSEQDAIGKLDAAERMRISKALVTGSGPEYDKYARQYPALAVMAPYLRPDSPKFMKLTERPGFTNYASKLWYDAAMASQQNHPDTMALAQLAIEETVSEVHHMRALGKESEVPQEWIDLANLVESEYERVTGRKSKLPGKPPAPPPAAKKPRKPRVRKKELDDLSESLFAFPLDGPRRVVRVDYFNSAMELAAPAVATLARVIYSDGSTSWNEPSGAARIELATLGIKGKKKDEAVSKFEDGLALAIRDAYRGKINRRELGRLLRSLVKEATEAAYVEALREADVEIDDTAMQEIDELYLTQEDFIPDFADAIMVAKAQPDMRARIDERAGMWAQSVAGAKMAGRANASKAEMVTWHLGRTEEHCETCTQLNGQRHRRSWFQVRRYFPRMPGAAMDCGGFNCLCTLTPDKGKH